MSDQDSTEKAPLALKLTNEVEEANWETLQPHYDRGALVFVSSELDLITVAVKVIQDDVEDIKQWSDNKLIYNPSETEDEVDKSVRYKFIITQPYVLIQPIAKEEKKE